MRAGDAAQRVGFGEIDEDRDRIGCRLCVRVCGDDELGIAQRDAQVRVCGKALWPLVVDQPYVVGQAERPEGQVRDQEHLAHLRSEGGQTALEVGMVSVADDDRIDPHRSSR